MKEKTSDYKLRIFGLFLLTIFISFVISSSIVGSAFSNAIFYNIFMCLTVFIPIVVFSFVIFIVIQRTKYAKYVTNRNVKIIALIISVFLIGNGILFYYEWSPPSGIVDTWHCEEGQLLCVNLSNSCSRFDIAYDNTYAREYGYLDFITSNYSGSFDFEWDFDKLSNVLTIFYNPETNRMGRYSPLDFEWEVKLRLEITDENKLITHYIGEDNAPFDANLLDGITWFYISY